MARKNTAGTAGQAAALPADKPVQPQEPTFHPFAWHYAVGSPLPADRVLTDAGQIRDLTAGAALVLELLERQELDVEEGERPMFTPQQQCDLMRLAITASRAAARTAEDLNDWAHRLEWAKKGGAA
jgi:hypothetical protein